MGLDQYMYVAAKAGSDSEHREIGYRRKHPNLHGWMERLWMEKDPGAHLQTSFNGVELELTWADLERLEQDVLSGNLPKTTGFFFGEGSDEYYRGTDLEFVKNAKAEVFMGLKVFYNSSW
jgi:hypothetical protein